MPQNKSDIIRKPWITEKTARLAEEGKYVFIVAKDAKSKQIKEAVQHIYNVHVLRTNIINVPSKSSEFKKAIVQLKEGEKIDMQPQ